MKVLVCLKRVVDFNVRVKVRPDGSGVMTEGVRMSINPFDEIALEEALRLRERGAAEEIVAVSVGPAEAQQQLRTGLAMGADHAILVRTDDALLPLDAARVLGAVVAQESPGLVLMGKQAIDDDCSQTGPMLSAMLGWPQATFVSKLELDGSAARCTREVDAGLETIEVDLPAVVTADLRLNVPRFVKLPEVLKAKKKPVEELTLEDLGVSVEGGLEALEYEAPPARQAGIRLESAAELVAKLREKGLVS